MRKLEVWFVWSLGPVYGVRHARGSTEFGSTRGYIHAHLTTGCDNSEYKTIDVAIADWDGAVVEATRKFRLHVN